MIKFNDKTLEKVINSYNFKGEFKSCEPTGSGLINSTFMLTFSDGNIDYSYILQEMNTSVFKNPDELMSNIMNVTGFLRNKIALDGGNPERETLTFLYTKDSASYCRDDDGKCWRVYNFIGNSYTCDTVTDPGKAYRSGKAFGRFQMLLSDYPINGLFETIPNFHNTPTRFDALKQAIESDACGRAAGVKDEIDFAMQREADSSRLTDLIKTGDLPVRVTHNDTKISNVLFDKITNDAFCVIDLDTVMPGLSLYDFGDSIRSGAVNSDENEKDLSKFGLNMELYKSYTDGFISEAYKALTPLEAELLPFSVKLLALECGVRFLTDYLNGDTYFKTEYPEHNLTRCHTQFKLVTDVETNLDEMNKITAELYRRALLEA